MSETLLKIDAFQQRFADLKAEIGRIIVGQEKLVDGVLTAIFADGHCLLEGLPGLGKTHLVKTLGEVFGLEFSRIQFTPDLMPADVTGTNIIVEDEDGRRRYDFRPGPIFSNLVLADEINRATPKTQSALLEAMQERSVTAWGTTHEIEKPLFILATQNPIEMEGTYPLPEAQLDRFLFKLEVPSVGEDDLCEIVKRTTGRTAEHGKKVMDRAELLEWQGLVRDVLVAPSVLKFAARLVGATQPDGDGAPKRVSEYVRFGGSPRAAQSMILGAKVTALRSGRANVSYVDIRSCAHATLRHRLVLGYQAQVDGVPAGALIDDILSQVPETQNEAE